MAAVASPALTQWVRMDSLVRRTDVNHRQARNEERIREYVRMLENGEEPPPVAVDRRTKTILNGYHRYEARRRFYTKRNKRPEDWLIEIVWKDDLPDPDREPVRFALETAAENRYNGEPLDHREVMRLLQLCIRQHGKEEAKRYAPKVNETPETVESLYRMMYPSPPPASGRLPTRPEQSERRSPVTEQAPSRQPPEAHPANQQTTQARPAEAPQPVNGQPAAPPPVNPPSIATAPENATALQGAADPADPLDIQPIQKKPAMQPEDIQRLNQQVISHSKALATALKQLRTTEDLGKTAKQEVYDLIRVLKEKFGA